MMDLFRKAKQHFLQDSLYRNSIYLMGSTFVIAFFGFLYWAIAAHLYTTTAVGLASTLVAISNVVMILSLLGYDNSFIHFLPKAKNPNEQLSTGFTAASITAFVVSSLYLGAIHLFVPKLSFVNGSLLWMGFFIVFMIINMLNFLNNYPFIAHRVTHIVLLINTGMGIVRLILLFGLKRFGFNGLLLSHVIAITLAMLVTFYFMKRRMDFKFSFRINWLEFKRTAKYTFNSYISTVFLTLPVFIIPTFVVGRLGASNAAYYYMVTTIIATLNVISLATSQSLFAEGVWDSERLNEQLKKAFKVILLLMVPAVAVLTLGGSIILSIFGKDYARAGYGLLTLLSLAGLPKIVSYLLSTVLRIQHKVGTVALIHVLYACVVLIGSYLGVRGGRGILSIGWATLAAEILMAAVYIALYLRNAPKLRAVTN